MALLIQRLALIKKKGNSYPEIARLSLFCLTLVFYGMEHLWWLFPFLTSIGFDFLWASLLKRETASARRKLWLGMSVVVNLSLLGYFKYGHFFHLTMSQLTQGRIPFPIGPGLALPAGISFYTFESLSFVIDVYRRDVEPPKRASEFLGFIGMFPRFIAGPIVRYREIAGQMTSYNRMNLDAGLFIFAVGFFFKACFADSFAIFVDYAFSKGVRPDFIPAWIGVFSYTMQIYFDFSGYSLMAIGLGRCVGFQFPTNFNQPYRSTSMQDFWQRWHMTLSRWLRDYLYIPLGGNRRGPVRTYVNLFITMLLVGLWHGAGWTFIAWGAWHGGWLALERAIPALRFGPRLGRCFTFLLVMIGWVFFRAVDFAEAAKVLKAMFMPWQSLGGFNHEAFQVYPLASLGVGLGLLYLLFGEPRVNVRAMETIEAPSNRLRILAVVLFAVSLSLSLSSFNIPFLYFQF